MKTILVTLIFGDDRLIAHESASDASLVEFKTHIACISFEDKFVDILHETLSSSLEYILLGRWSLDWYLKLPQLRNKLAFNRWWQNSRVSSGPIQKKMFRVTFPMQNYIDYFTFDSD